MTEGFWDFSNVDGGVRIDRYTGDLPVVEIPGSLGEKTVVELGEEVFRKKTMHTVKIPSTVHTIKGDSWYGCFRKCESLMTVEGLENVDSIGQNAFNGCIALQNLTFSNELTYIGANAFRNTNMTETLALPNSLESIGEGAFANDTALEEISLGSSIQVIGGDSWEGGAFAGCTSLTTIDTSASVRYINQSAFAGCTSLQSISLKFGLLEIGQYAFDNCSALESADIPNSVTKFGNRVFRNCSSLKSIFIPNSVVTFPDSSWDPAFSGCEQVEIRGYAGSKAEQYAGENENLTFTALPAILSTDFVFDTKKVEMKKGESIRLTYTITPADTTDAVIWESSNSNIVSVNQPGEITARNPGSINIIAKTTSGFSYYMEVKAANDPTRVAFDDNRQKTISIGQSITQTARAYEGTIIRNDIPITYESSNPSIATVDRNGVVRGLKEGTVRITARAEGYNFTAYYSVRVVNSSGNGK